MAWVFEEPSVVLVCITLAAVLFLIEVALPTVGVAGTAALVSGGVAAVGIGRQDLTWWPLFGAVFAVCLWAAIIARHRRSPTAEALALAGFGGGGAAFAAVNHDGASVVATVACTAILGLGFPRVYGAASRLIDRPASVGMDAFVGRTAVVDRWDGDQGVVLLDGSRWNAAASGPVALVPGAHVTITGYHGNTVAVTPALTSGSGSDPFPTAPPQLL
jgi:membrane-bound ClpP family serine protease